MSLENMIRVIPHRIDRAAMSLSIDRALFDIMKNDLENKKEIFPILRTYQFSNPAIIFGNHQSLEGRYNPNGKRVDIVKRDTGGGHLYLDINDIHFSFIAPFSYYKTEDLITQYQKINGIVVSALKNLGYNAHLGRTSIRIDNKILVGTARKHEKNVALHQGVILYTKYDNEIFKLLNARPDEIERWNKLVTSLQEYKPDFKKIPQEIISSIGEHYEEPLNRFEISKARELYYSKYTNSDYIKEGNKNEDICLIALEYTKDDDKKN